MSDAAHETRLGRCVRCAAPAASFVAPPTTPDLSPAPEPFCPRCGERVITAGGHELPPTDAPAGPDIEMFDAGFPVPDAHEFVIREVGYDARPDAWVSAINDPYGQDLVATEDYR